MESDTPVESISNATALEYYKKICDKHISKQSLVQHFCDKLHCQPSDINVEALKSKLYRLRCKDKITKGAYRHKLRGERFVIPLSKKESLLAPLDSKASAVKSVTHTHTKQTKEEQLAARLESSCKRAKIHGERYHQVKKKLNTSRKNTQSALTQ